MLGKHDVVYPMKRANLNFELDAVAFVAFVLLTSTVVVRWSKYEAS